MDVHLESVEGKIFYPAKAGHQIGTVSINNMKIPAGSVGDGLAVISLSIERWAALNIARLYYEGMLQVGAAVEVFLILGLKLTILNVLTYPCQMRN